MSHTMLRILCLHGYRQNDQTFRERTGAFRKIIKKQAELVFISAPNQIAPLETEREAGDASAGKTEDQRGWWFSRQDDYYMAQDVTNCCKGYEESLDVIKKAFKEQGPFDGVLGFSQGACMLTLVCSLRESNPDMFSFNFAIFVAGFKSRSTPHISLYDTVVNIPTLHILGETDRVIPKDMSEEILCYYRDPKVVNHPGGHFIPASGQLKKIYLEFLHQMATLKISRHS